ncbi:MAG: hypothetical protein GX929_02415 [Clostridiales bacterium]|nr:hypothetical protein [Clostridiales bacterium]
MKLELNGDPPKNKKQMLERLREIVNAGWLEMPDDVKRYNGTGGPGNFLEDLLGLTVGNQDIADCLGWEVKYFTPKTALITLFHKEPEPKKILRYMVSKYGWEDKYGRLSFRHTIHGRSDRFAVYNDAGSIIVRALHDGNDPVPTWSHDMLLNIAGNKLRRLVTAEGERNGRKVTYKKIELYENIILTQLMQNLVNGRIVIDFDVREMKAGSDSLRNHGTKFRISPKDLKQIYEKHEVLGP